MKLVAIPLLLLFGAVSWPATAEPRRSSCATAGKGLAASARVRVYSTNGGDVFYACDLRRRRRHLLATSESGPGGSAARNFRVAGRVVAYQYEECDRLVGCVAQVVVVDGTTARGSWPASSVTGTLIGLRVNARGEVAYLDQQEETIAVRAITRRRARVLSSSSSIDPTSLALGSGFVYWTEEGTARSAVL